MTEDLKIVIKAITDAAEKALADVAQELKNVEEASRKASVAYSQLSQDIDKQSKDLRSLKEQYVDVVRKYGEASKEAAALGAEIERVSSELKENKSAYAGAMKAADAYDKTVEEVDDAQKKVKNSSNDMQSAMNKIKSTVKTLTASITLLIAGLTKLGTSGVEQQKIFGRLEAGFAATGQSAKQAHSVYKGFYRFLGDDQAALEAANLLSQLTGEMEHQEEWIKVLQGAYASLPYSITTESLMESINETVKVGKVVGQTADALNWLGVSEDAVNAKLETLNSTTEREAYLRELMLGLYGGSAEAYERINGNIMAYYEAQANLNGVLASTSQYLTPLLTELSNMAAVLLQVLAPAIQFVSQVLIVFIRWIVGAANVISQFFGGSGAKINETTNSMKGFGNSIGGATTGMNKLGSGIDSANKKAKELKKLTMGFDELNVVNPASSGAAAGGGAGGIGAGGASVPSFEMPNLGEMLDLGLTDLYEGLDEVEERIESILFLAGLAGVAFGAWKIIEGIKAGTLLGNLKTIGGYALIIGGALLLVQGYSDAWVNGLDWGNLLMIIGGIAGIVGGLAIVVGPMAAAIALIAGGIALVVIGIKDFAENGYSMEAVIAILVGAVAILVGVLWAFNSALLANPITWVVVAVMALVAVFVILWNECDGFRQFWLDLWEGIKKAFNAIVEWFKEAGKAIAKFFVDAWESIKKAWSAVGQWFKNVGQSIKNVFSGIGKWFSDIFTGAWNGIKKAFSAVGSFFTGIWNNIKSIFSKVGDAIGGAVSKAFSNAINWVLEKAIGIINGFIGAINTAISIINKIPGVNIKTLNKLEVPKLAKGGIVDRATLAMFGEAGKEAVIPLENNTEWMDILAERINQRNNAPSKIVLMLDKKELGWANINSINDITQQTGTLQLTLA